MDVNLIARGALPDTARLQAAPSQVLEPYAGSGR